LEHYAPGALEAGAAADSGPSNAESPGSLGGTPPPAAASAGAPSLNLVVGEEDGGPSFPAHVDLPDGTEDTGRPSSPGPPRASRQVTGEGKVVGNMRIVGERQIPDIPEDMAKAVRTMMSKDEA
jgi:hypothetical protein